MHDPVDRLHAGRLGRVPRGRKQADREIGAGALKAERVEPIGVDPLPRLVELREAGMPRRRRIGLVQPQHEDQLLPEPGHGRLLVHARMDETRPVGRRPRDDRPVGRLGVDHLEVLRERRQRVAARTRRVDAGQEPRRHLRGDRDAHAVSLAEIEQPSAVPVRDEIEGVFGRPLEPGPLHMRVEIPGVDEARPPFVGRRGDEPCERCRTRLRDDPDGLTGLDVRPDLDDEACVAAEERVVHGCESLSVRPDRLQCDPHRPFNPVQRGRKGVECRTLP